MDDDGAWRATAQIESPCIGVCKLDARDVCCGCGRSIAEIGAWRNLSNTQKEAVLALARQRCALSNDQSEALS